MPLTDQPPTNAARSAPPGASEVTEIHTRLLRVALAVEESRAYWTHVEPHRSSHDRIE